MRKLYMCLIAIGLLGCDGVVREEPLPPRIETREVSCSHAGYCYTCAPGLDGKFECGFKVSMACDGNQQARVTVNSKKLFYESGAQRISESIVIQERLSSCQ